MTAAWSWFLLKMLIFFSIFFFIFIYLLFRAHEARLSAASHTAILTAHASVHLCFEMFLFHYVSHRCPAMLLAAAETYFALPPLPSYFLYMLRDTVSLLIEASLRAPPTTRLQRASSSYACLMLLADILHAFIIATSYWCRFIAISSSITPCWFPSAFFLIPSSEFGCCCHYYAMSAGDYSPVCYFFNTTFRS